MEALCNSMRFVNPGLCKSNLKGNTIFKLLTRIPIYYLQSVTPQENVSLKAYFNNFRNWFILKNGKVKVQIKSVQPRWIVRDTTVRRAPSSNDCCKFAKLVNWQNGKWKERKLLSWGFQKPSEMIETCCCMRMLKISWHCKIANNEVLERMNEKLRLLGDIAWRKAEFLEHVTWGSNGKFSRIYWTAS